MSSARAGRPVAALVIAMAMPPRFDLPGNTDGVLYFAESPDHAVAESVQQFRNSAEPLTNSDLTRWGHRSALVSATLDPAIWSRIVDLCELTILDRIGLTAEMPALRDRRRTQEIARGVHEKGHSGPRWWSSFWGEWHSVVVFRDQLTAGALTYGQPRPLDVTSAAALDASALLGIG